MDILIIGEAGQLGQELLSLDWPADVRVHAPILEDLDFTDLSTIDRAIAGRAWTAVINAAAYTAVDKAETDAQLAWAINAVAPAHLARLTRDANIPLIHVSTDYVFGGDKDDYYETEDPIAPRSVYGASKAAGDLAVLSGAPRAVIVRTAWLYSRHGANFVKTMLRLGAEREELRVVADQRGSPTSAADLARAISEIASRLARREGEPGLYHFVNSGEATWWEFATAIFERAQLHGARMPKIDPISTADYPTAATRPANSRLSTARIEKVFDITPRPWRDALNEVVDALAAPRSENTSKRTTP